MKILKILLVVILGIAILAFAAYKFFKAEKQEILITMDDGVKLSTSVFVPRGKGPFPAVLVRTPYNKYGEEWLGQAFNIFRIAVVLQDTRGKFKSEGEPMVLLGPVGATIWFSSTAECTDFYVLLQDEFPDGKIINIQEGGTKVKFSKKEPLKTEISVWATGYQLNPGHKLRVVITSSWFPRFNRNLNICDPAAVATTMAEAKQTVMYGPDTPSSVNLPVYIIPQQ